jgi:hypothetical protein
MLTLMAAKNVWIVRMGIFLRQSLRINITEEVGNLTFYIGVRCQVFIGDFLTPNWTCNYNFIF